MSVFCDWNIFVSLTSNRFTYILYFKERNIYDLIHLLKKIHFCGYFIIGNYLTTVICYMFYCFVFPQIPMNQMVIIQKLLVLPVLVDLSIGSFFQEHRHSAQT